MADTVQLKINLDGTQAQRVLDRLERDSAFKKLRDDVRSFGRELDVVFSDSSRIGGGGGGGGSDGGGDGLAGALLGLTRSFKALSGALAVFKLGGLAADTAQAGLALNKVDTVLQTVFGSTQAAAREFEFVRETAARLSLDLQATASGYALLSASTKNTALEGQATRDIFLAVAEAGGKLQLSAEEINGTLVAFRQIASGATLQTDELNQIAERIPGAFAIAARALGVATDEVKALVASGRVATADFLPKFAAETRKTFGTTAQTEIRNYASGFQTLTREASILAKDGFTPIASAASSVAGAIGELIGKLNDYRKAANGNLEDLGNGITRARDSGALFEQRRGGLVPLQQFDPRDPEAINRVSRGDIRNVSPLAPRPIVPDVSRLVPDVSPTGPSGAALLTRGVPVADAEKLAKYAKELAAAKADLAGLTQVQRVQQSILNGELSTRNVLEQNAALALARAQDAQAARVAGTKAVTAATKDSAQAAEESLRNAIADEAALQALVTSVLTPVEAFKRQLAEINRLAADGTLAEAAGRVGTTADDIRSRLLIRAGENLPSPDAGVEDTARNLEVLTTLAEQAARNVQDAFANFLFDPLNGGLRGFAANFARTLQQIAAEAAASGILRAVFGGLASSSPFLASLGAAFGGGRALGGPVTPGRLYEVNERIPELLSTGGRDYLLAGSRGGDITPLRESGNGGASYVVNVDARNATNPAEIRAQVEAGVRIALATVDRNSRRGLPASG